MDTLDLFFKLYIVIPIVLLVVTIFIYINSFRKFKNYKKADGTIIDFYENTNEVRLNSYEHKAISPVISYKVNETEYEFIGNFCSTSMKKGDVVTILYDPHNPKKASIKNGLYFAPIILSLLTTISFIVLIIIKIIS